MSPPQVLHLALSSFPKINRAVATLFAFSIATFACFGVSGCSRLRNKPIPSNAAGTNNPLASLGLDPSVVTEAIDPGPASHDRAWRIEQAVLPFAQLSADQAIIRNVRKCRWKTPTDKTVQHSDWTIQWADVRGVDFVVVPFPTMPILAHTMLSFRIADGRVLVVSVEARLENGEVYSPLAGAARQFELMYVIGDEEDLYGIRANARRDDIYLYPSTASPKQAAELLRSILIRTNSIAAQPEYYDSLSNNCTTNIIDHVMQLRGDDPSSVKLQYQWRTRFPGNSDVMAYELGLIQTDKSFEETKRDAWVSGRIRQYIGQADFSQRIRQ